MNRNILLNTDKHRLRKILIHVIIVHIVNTNTSGFLSLSKASGDMSAWSQNIHIKANSNQPTIQNVSFFNTKHLYIWSSPKSLNFYSFYPDGGTLYTWETNKFHSLEDIEKKNNNVGLANENVRFT